ncbi:hypothetical protein [Neobacillus ginsengisoli]|uniref:Uncharacterized protein n=1 Tax=Neobacillus ginsengisoli TaxID=904295 RepID=A0ABT9XWW2_9BACI|nr:hypothetical protein [Neobacillus ginsengisoli]MDQ0200004.1 hypothetical protein [Neobacillus ginsengisoli]
MIIPNINVTTISFDHNNGLIVGYMTDKAKLMGFNLTNKETVDLKAPNIGKTAIEYVQQNPAKGTEFTFATLDKDIYMTKNTGSTWTEIVDKGVANGITK